MVWWKSLWFPRKSIQLMVPASSAHIARNQPLWDVTEGKHTSHRFALTIKVNPNPTTLLYYSATWLLHSTPLESGIKKKKVKM